MAVNEFTSFTAVDAPKCDNKRDELVTGNKTLVAGDSGKTFFVKRGTSIFSLPATAVGLSYDFAYIGGDAGGQIQVSPVAADGIAAAGSAVVNKDVILATATIKKGDWLRVTSGVGATGVTAWFVSSHRGVLTKEA
jgi:hypothetical protein